ncbi:MAG: nuclear transport factor 2 family protein [Myxococcales bacterium]|nr:nuclear transport factor 2 family protein [Myxococcales bacterium]
MSIGSEERGNPSSLRGWLSEVFFPAILASELEPLLLRLGARATLDEPMFGRSSGLADLSAHLERLREKLAETNAKFERYAFVTGIDRDMTEGTLEFDRAELRLALPIAVVAERRRSREVELRVYCRARELPRCTGRAPLSLPPLPAVLPDNVRALLDAFAAGDPVAASALFDPASFTREPTARQREGRANIAAGFVHLLAGGVNFFPTGMGDDGRHCIVEGALLRVHGAEVRPTPSLFVLERSDQGLFRSLRIYDDALFSRE